MLIYLFGTITQKLIPFKLLEIHSFDDIIKIYNLDYEIITLYFLTISNKEIILFKQYP